MTPPPLFMKTKEIYITNLPDKFTNNPQKLRLRVEIYAG